MNATPTKLRSGAWGARVRSEDVHEGDTVTITTRAGKSWDARVARVVWSGSGVSICATESLDRPSRTIGHKCPRNCQSGSAQIWEECDCCGAEPIYM